MSSEEVRKSDLLGLAPYGEAIKIVAKGTVDGAGAFLGRICLPAAEELGEYFRDHVKSWRSKNTISILTRAEQKAKKVGLLEGNQIHPKLLFKILDEASTEDNDLLQEMWSGLIVSSCSEDGSDDGNLIFIDLIARLTSTQALVLEYACLNCEKALSEAGWLYSKEVLVNCEKLAEITGVTDLHRLDRELDHLRSLDLIQGGFRPDSNEADITPTPLALHFFARCRGGISDAVAYYNARPEVILETGLILIDRELVEAMSVIEKQPDLKKLEVSQKYIGARVKVKCKFLSASEISKDKVYLNFSMPIDQYKYKFVRGYLKIGESNALKQAVRDMSFEVEGVITKISDDSVDLVKLVVKEDQNISKSVRLQK